MVLDGKGRLGLPLALRQVVGATAGAFVFLVGDPATGTATAHSTTALDQMTGASYDAA